MKRRTFLTLAGIAAGSGLPLRALAGLLHGDSIGPGRNSDRLPSEPDPWEDIAPSVQIRVIGVGGAGCNLVDHFIRQGIFGVEYVAIDTDSATLQRSLASTRISLGDQGACADANPDVARAAAEKARCQIAAALANVHMVFIVAGMGGGTGTGAAPVVAEMAREQGLLTVAIVIEPFDFEGGPRQAAAKAGQSELQKHVDSLIVFRNDSLTAVLGDAALVNEALDEANKVVRNAVRGITDIITIPGLVGIDFEDVRTVLHASGQGVMGVGIASGTHRASQAAERAMAHSFFDGVNPTESTGILVNVTASKSLRMREINEVMSVARSFASENANILFGAIYDPGMESRLMVSVFLTHPAGQS